MISSNFFYFEPNPLTTAKFLNKVFELSLTENKEIIINLIRDQRHRSNFQSKLEEFNQCINYFKSLENDIEENSESKDKKIIILKLDENSKKRGHDNDEKSPNKTKTMTTNDKV